MTVIVVGHGDDMSNLREQAEKIVQNNAAWGFASGILPLPFVDIAALTVIEIRMLEQLANLYEVPFSRIWAEAYVSALLGGLASAKFGFGAFRAVLFAVPFAGPVLGAASLSTTGALITYALGRLFIREFEAGRIVMEFDPNRVQPTDGVPNEAPVRKE